MIFCGHLPSIIYINIQVSRVLGVLLNIHPEMRQSTSDFLASFLMGVATGGIISFFQWIVLRNFLSNAKWWILVGVIGNSTGTAINSVVLPPGGVSDLWRGLVITIPLIGLFKGFLEWLVLRKDLQNSARWMSVRVITNIIVVAISLIEFGIRTSLNLTIWGYFLILFSAGMIEGIIFGVITGYTLSSFIERKNEKLVNQVQ
jgi:hypothetical protein